MNAEELINEIYNGVFRGNLNNEGITKLIEEFHPKYKNARIAIQYGENARDMYECVETALHHFNPRWDNQNWMYFTIGGHKTCKDVLKWLKEVIDDHINYRIEHADDED